MVMGPKTSANRKAAALLHRPKFYCDIKQIPWTDRRGPQDGYAESVDLCNDFRDLLDDSNFNKIPR